jgi:hypothetical protein
MINSNNSPSFSRDSRDLRAYLIHFNRKASVAGIDSKDISSVDNALWQSLEKASKSGNGYKLTVWVIGDFQYD